jgi:quercetin dioxygenase-like cupin family protein
MTTKPTSQSSILLAGIAAAFLFATSTVAQAGECPANQVSSGVVHEGGAAPVDVTDTVLGMIDLSKESIMVEDRLFRMRRLEIEPGGVVPLHDHGDRPALIYIIEGSITEYSNNCMVPIQHNAGEIAMESVGLMHWWQNTGDTKVVLISADILHTEEQDDDSMM